MQHPCGVVTDAVPKEPWVNKQQQATALLFAWEQRSLAIHSHEQRKTAFPPSQAISRRAQPDQLRPWGRLPLRAAPPAGLRSPGPSRSCPRSPQAGDLSCPQPRQPPARLRVEARASESIGCARPSRSRARPAPSSQPGPHRASTPPHPPPPPPPNIKTAGPARPVRCGESACSLFVY